MRSGSAVSARGLLPVGLGAKPLGGLALMLGSGLSCAWRSGPAVAGPLIVGMIHAARPVVRGLRERILIAWG